MFATIGYLLSATSHVKRRRNNDLGLMFATRGYLLSATSHVNKKEAMVWACCLLQYKKLPAVCYKSFQEEKKQLFGPDD